MDKEEIKLWRGKYQRHHYGAKRRKVEFKLTFEEWLKIWVDSGHLHERGRRRDQYCMARTKDTGPYAVGNVRITTGAENLAEVVLREPSRLRMRKAKLGKRHRLGKKHTPETKAKISAAMKGRKPSAECIAKAREACLGRKLSPEHRKKISEAGKGNKNAQGHFSRRGTHHTKAARKKMREATLRLFADPEFRARFSAAQKRRFAREKQNEKDIKTLRCSDDSNRAS